MPFSKRSVVAAGGVALALVGMARAARRRAGEWRATAEECAAAWPMDEVIPEPSVVTTRGITIDASPEAVWPWLAQMGELPRGGFYSHVSVERMLGMKVQNADGILPEFQELSVGLAFDRRGTMLVQGFELGHWLVLGPPPMDAFASTWLLDVVPQGPDQSRLISRVRVEYKRRSLPNLLIRLVLKPGQLIMERKMFAGIKGRAERLQDELPEGGETASAAEPALAR